MANLRIFSFIVAILALAVTASSASPSRVNELVTVNEETGTLQFDPVDGFNDTTQDPEWQRKYMESLNINEIITRHWEEHDSLLARQELALVARADADHVGCVSGSLETKRHSSASD